jgi:4-amino-4-deoxy-L-arabinose transferase-like glycosyltransferase
VSYTEPVEPRLSIVAAWRWWIIPASLTLLLALIFQDPFAGDWDALDYTILAIKGHPSSMLFGRMLFIYTNHLLWSIAHTLFNLPTEYAYLLFKYAVIVQSPIAIVACWTLAYELTRNLRVSTIASLLISLSPFFVTYSGQAMTEIPSILLFAVALTIHIRGIRERRVWLIFIGASLLGLSVNIREVGAIVHAPWLLVGPLVYGWRLGKREILITITACLLFCLSAFGPFAYWFFMNVNGYQAEWYGWAESMRIESARHPVTIYNLLKLLLFFLLTSPLVLLTFPHALKNEWQNVRVSPLFAIALIGFIGNLSLFFNYSTAINPRYLLTGLPTIAPLVAKYLWHITSSRIEPYKRALTIVVLIISTLAVSTGYVIYHFTWRTIRSHGYTKDYISRLRMLPHDAVVMAGTQTVSVTFWRGIGTGNWTTISKGAGWPGPQLIAVIQSHLREGRRVFLDADPHFWPLQGWHLEETKQLIEIEDHFRFKHVSETIYEIKDLQDTTARDRPELQRLLIQKAL